MPEKFEERCSEFLLGSACFVDRGHFWTNIIFSARFTRCFNPTTERAEPKVRNTVKIALLEDVFKNFPNSYFNLDVKLNNNTLIKKVKLAASRAFRVAQLQPKSFLDRQTSWWSSTKLSIDLLGARFVKAWSKSCKSWTRMSRASSLQLACSNWAPTWWPVSCRSWDSRRATWKLSIRIRTSSKGSKQPPCSAQKDHVSLKSFKAPQSSLFALHRLAHAENVRETSCSATVIQPLICFSFQRFHQQILHQTFASARNRRNY